MLQIARLSPTVLGDAASLVGEFIQSQQHEDGGFCDRDGSPDLYYSVFGTEAALALQVPFDQTALISYLKAQTIEDLDFVHLCSLIRVWASLKFQGLDQQTRELFVQRLESYRSHDGGFAQHEDCETGTVYAGFLAFGCYQDLKISVPDLDRFTKSLLSLKAADGGFANQSEVPSGLTPPTAAAAMLLRRLGHDIDRELCLWLVNRCLPTGGFFATEFAPAPDLLSTATALHALCDLKFDIAPLAEPSLDFVDTLWTNRGGFFGFWEDDAIDCEYTYYALLALGHLSLQQVPGS